MNQRADSSAIEKAMNATRKALEYSQRIFADDGLVSYNHEEAIRLGREAAQLLGATHDNYAHSVWHMSKHGDPAMMEVDPGAFYLIKEHVSYRASEESIFKSMPLELWADHIEWWK